MHASPSCIAPITTALEDKKAENITVMDVHALTSVCDYMIIANGNSTQQVHALANCVVEEAKKQGIEILGVEGENNREWVLVDLGKVIVHIMLPATRAYYELEKLWSVDKR